LENYKERKKEAINEWIKSSENSSPALHPGQHSHSAKQQFMVDMHDSGWQTSAASGQQHLLAGPRNVK
jgi:hypothetical protein